VLFLKRKDVGFDKGNGIFLFVINFCGGAFPACCLRHDQANGKEKKRSFHKGIFLLKITQICNCSHMCDCTLYVFWDLVKYLSVFMEQIIQEIILPDNYAVSQSKNNL